MENKYSLILFDMDGTIANTDQLVVDTFNELYDNFRGGRRTPVEEVYYFSGPPLRESLLKEFPDGDLEMLFKEFYERSKKKYDEIVTPYPYSREVKLELKRRGAILGVVTNKMHEAAVRCLEVIGLDDVFDILIGYDDVAKCKPDAEGIYKAMKMANITDLKKVLYVGDNPLDYETAKNAKVDSVLVTWGPRKLPKDIKPTYKIDDYRELLEVVKI